MNASRTGLLWLCSSLLLAFCFLSARAGAWNRAGHMVSGAFVYSLLQREAPRSATYWTEILKQHPHFRERWLQRMESVPVAEHDACLWMLAARWPDDIRGEEAYDRPEWHYINFPFKPRGQPDSVTTEGPAEVNIITAYRLNLEVLKGTATDAEKAVALCWLLHLVGDVHQPLHTTKLFTIDFPAPVGDRGGTLFFIRATADAEVITLHKFWDDLILGSEDFRAAGTRAIRLRTTYPSSVLRELAPHSAEADFRAWAEVEGPALARQKVYLEGRLLGSNLREQGPVLPDGYARSAQPVAEYRLALAAHRLSHLIRNLRSSDNK